MKNKGFTITEVIVVVVIIGILALIAIPSVSNLITNGKERYNKALDQELVVMAKDYLNSNKELLPRGQRNDTGEGVYTTTVDLIELEKNNYVTNDVVDADKGSCATSFVYVDNQDGIYKYYACLRCENYKSDNVYCPADTSQKPGTGPSPTCTITFEGKTNEWTNTNVKANITGEHERGIAFFRRGDQVIPADDDNEAEYQITESVTEFKIDVYSRTGNKGSCALDEDSEIKIDKVEPTCTVTASPAGASTTKELTIVGTDANSKVARITYVGFPPTELTLTASGNNVTGKMDITANGTYRFKVVDNAGNEGSCHIDIDNIDREAPVIGTLTKARNTGNKNVVVTAPMTDNMGIVGWQYTTSNTAPTTWRAITSSKTTSQTFTTTSATTYYIWAKDAAGNVSASKSIAINAADIDFTVPTLTKLSITSSNANKSFARVSDTITLTATFNETVTGATMKIAGNTVASTCSGTTCTGKLVVASGHTNGKVAVSVSNYKDAQSNNNTTNITTINEGSVTIDTQAPTITWTKSGPGVSITISLTLKDNVGVITWYDPTYGWRNIGSTTSTTGSFSVSSANTYTVYAKDAAGNQGSASVSLTSSDFDNNPPTCVLTYSGSTVSIAVGDVGTGVKGYIINTSATANNTAAAIGTTKIGSIAASENVTYYCHVADNAGNVTNTAGRSFTCSYSGWTTNACSGCESRTEYQTRSCSWTGWQGNNWIDCSLEVCSGIRRECRATGSELCSVGGTFYPGNCSSYSYQCRYTNCSQQYHHEMRCFSCGGWNGWTTSYCTPGDTCQSRVVYRSKSCSLN